MSPNLQSTEAPDFTLTDARGQTVHLADYRGKKHLVLIFNRGFAWPFCRRHMAQLRQDYAQFVARGAEVIAIGPEDPRSFAQWWQEHDMPFVGAGDPDHRVAGLYGQEVNPVKLGRMPAQFVIDRDGHIRYQHHSNAMWDIPADEEILALLDQLNLPQGQS